MTHDSIQSSKLTRHHNMIVVLLMEQAIAPYLVMQYLTSKFNQVKPKNINLGAIFYTFTTNSSINSKLLQDDIISVVDTSKPRCFQH